MGLFAFSQYGLLNKSQRPRLQRALSHRCHRQPPDSARAHGDPPRPLDATDSRRAAPARKAPSLALRIVLKPPRRHRSKFSARTATFCFYEAILRDKTNFQRLDRRNEAASQRTDCLSQKSRKGRSPQRSPKKGADRHNRRQVPFVSMMCIRAVVRLALLHGAAHGCPLQPQISLCQPWERWVPIAAAGQRERRRAFDTLPAIHLHPPQLRNNQPFTKAK